MRLASVAVFLVLATLASPPASSASAGIYTQPDLHADRLVFVSEGDLWTARLHGASHGGAPSTEAPRRLTTHEGAERYPQFSPDGAWIAFTGDYQGNGDVYVVPSEGGEPRRLTWHPDRDEVIGWMAGGERIVFRSRRTHPHGSFELFTVPREGGAVSKLPLGWAARIDVDPETGRWAFNRLSRETRTWKRYRGGTASDLWVGDPEREDWRRLTEFEGTDHFPMWHGGRIYFLSDRDATMNLWSILPDGSDPRQHTHEDAWDLRWPSMAPDGRIVFVRGADLGLYDPEGGRVFQAIDIGGESEPRETGLGSDRPLTRLRFERPGRWITSWDLAPTGDRLLVVTRGELFSVPVAEGVTLPLTEGSAARERGASYGPEGEKIVLISDEAGEEGLRILDAWAREGEQDRWLKEPGEAGWHFPPAWSPDGARIAWADQTQTLWVASAKGGSPRQVDHCLQDEIREYAWSPDGRWLAYTVTLDNDLRSIRIYDTRGRASHAVTGATTDDFSPAWDPEGRWLWFLSNRSMNPYIGWRDFETVELRTGRPHLLVLARDGENPLADLEGMPGRGAADEARDEEDSSKEDTLPEVRIDLEGLAERVVALPVDRGDYVGLQAAADRVFWLAQPLEGMAEQPAWWEEAGPRTDLMTFDLEGRETTPFVEGVAGYDLEPGAGELAFSRGPDEIYVVSAASPPGDDLGEARVDLGGIVLELDPKAEWRQIYYEGWRHMRDFHWDPGLGGLDWEAVRDRYATLLPRLSTREELRDLMGELIGELATSHTYVWGGDPGVEVESIPTGLLGADVERVAAGWRITRIYRGDPADEERSPLDEPEVGVEEGDYILAVNQRGFQADRPFHAAFENLAGRKVLLTVSERSDGRRPRQVVVTPLRSDRGLRYADWVRRNREYVAEKTDGRIGYIHIPDMGADGLIEFDTWFYPQLDREGMVVDVRWNGGGFVSQLILERLRRPVTAWSRARGGGSRTYPYRSLRGPFVVLTNQFAGSDGDIFPAAVQLEDLAPVIGMRSWGGVVGIRADKRLVDSGMLTQPEFAWWDRERGWGLENRGVEPDIVVANPPEAVAHGRDPQLDRGIQVVLELREQEPPQRPDFGPEPHKTRESFRR